MTKDIERGEDARKNWRHINELKEQVRQLESRVRNLTAQVEWLRQRPTVKDGGGDSGTARWV